VKSHLAQPSPKGRVFSRIVLVMLGVALSIGIVLMLRAYYRSNAPAAMQDDSQATTGNAPLVTRANGYPLPMPNGIPAVPSITPAAHPSMDPEQKSVPAGSPQRRSLATGDPNAPITILIHGEGESHTPISVRESSVIILGTVRKVQPARWTTADGRRPTNARGAKDIIFRPALVEVEEYLKGEQPMRHLNIFAWGGTVGQDSARMEPDYLYDLHEGERVVLFLRQHQVSEHSHALNNQPFWFIFEHYTITPQGEATNAYRTIAVDALRAEIADALQKP
jgi:hypothetical protein